VITDLVSRRALSAHRHLHCVAQRNARQRWIAEETRAEAK
jgi:hypothetical protein